MGEAVLLVGESEAAPFTAPPRVTSACEFQLRLGTARGRRFGGGAEVFRRGAAARSRHNIDAVIAQRHLDAELASNEEFLRRLQGNEYKPSEDMPKENLDMQRRVKAASAQLPELQDRVAQLAASVDSNHPTIDDIASQEEAYLELLSRKKELDAQLAAFQGLPSDPDRARAELEALRRQLRGMTSRRDEVFEGLVEQASPVRRR